jgi:hypothetical protein
LYPIEKDIKIYLLFLHGCETWSLILREENRLKVFKNMGFEPKRGSKRRLEKLI